MWLNLSRIDLSYLDQSVNLPVTAIMNQRRIEAFVDLRGMRFVMSRSSRCPVDVNTILVWNVISLLLARNRADQGVVVDITLTVSQERQL